MAEKLTAQQRAQLFQLSTRQNLQMMAKKTTATANTTLEFQLPKARLLETIYLRIKATINVKHATATKLACDYLTKHGIIQQYKVDLNNGFSPFTISGKGMAMMAYLDRHADMFTTKDSDFSNAITEFKCSSAGTDNEFFFTIPLSVALNGRDPVGLLLLQSEQTVCDLRVSVGSASDMWSPAELSGYTVDIKEVTVEPMLTTYSIPANSEAFPDLSILKLVQDRTDAITSAGQNIVKLSTGTIYRKLVLYFTDAEGKPMTADKFNGTIDLVFNQADCNIAVSPEMLRAVNSYHLGTDLPEGMYVFDFSDCSYGSSRDYIDTEKLTEFWLRFNSANTGKVRVVSECLSRLI